MRHQLSQTTSLNNMLHMNSPRTACLYVPVTWNPDQTRFQSTLHLHIRNHKFFQNQNRCEHLVRANTTTPVPLESLSRFTACGITWLTSSNSTQLLRFSLNQYFQLDSIIPILFYSFPNLILFSLYPFESAYMIWLIFSDPILLTTPNLNWLGYPYIIQHLLHELDSPFTIQLSSTNSILSHNFRFNFELEFLIQFFPFLQFDSNATTSIQLTVYNLTWILWFNLTQNYWFNWTHFTHQIGLPLHTFHYQIHL